VIYIKFFTYVTAMNFILAGSCYTNAIVSDFCGNIYIPKSFAVFYNLILLSVNYPLYQLL